LRPGPDRTFLWIRKANGKEDRQRRKDAAEQTLNACKFGGYILEGTEVRFKHIAELKEGSCIVRADEAERAPRGPGPTIFRHGIGKLVDVAVDLSGSGHNVAAVSAASAYHMGGSFRDGGRHALEEAMCMQTTLYQSLKEVLEQERASRVPPPAGSPPAPIIPVDGAVLSPMVEVFRGGTSDGYPFWTIPVTICAVVSVAMPNCNPNVKDAPVDAPEDRAAYDSLLSRKFIAACTAAARSGATTLVLPDVGCGVYGNLPADVGSQFGKILKDRFSTTFKELHLVGLDDFCKAAESAMA